MNNQAGCKLETKAEQLFHAGRRQVGEAAQLLHADRKQVGKAARLMRLGGLLAAIVLLIAACGKGQHADEGSGGKAFTIRVGAWFIDDRAFMQEFKTNTEQAYKKLYPQATIQWDITLGDAYFGKLETQLASNSAPDVFFHQHVLSLLEAGYLADLSDEPWAFKFIPQIQEFLTYKASKDEFKRYDGKVYAASMGVGIRGYWYNKTLFNKLGLQAPQNLQQFLAICEQLKEEGYLPLAAGYKDRWALIMHFETLLQSIGYGSDEYYGRSLFEQQKRLNGAEVVQALRFFETLREQGYMNQNALSIDWMQSVQLFTSGKAAIVMQGPWLPGTVEGNFSQGAKRFELGYFPVSDEQGYYDLEFSSDQYVSVNAASLLPEESKALVGAMLSEAVHLPFARGNGLLPALADMKASFDNPVMEEVFSYAHKAASNKYWPHFVSTESKDMVLEEAQNILAGVPLDMARLSDAQAKLEEALDSIVPPVK